MVLVDLGRFFVVFVAGVVHHSLCFFPLSLFSLLVCYVWFYVMLCYVTVCYVILCDVMLCYAMLFYVTLCYVL